MSTHNREEQKRQANEFRKAGKLNEALALYRVLSAEACDKYDGAGLLHCLRKLELYDEALPLADELIKKYPDYPWCKTEVTWTYIKGGLDKLSDDAPLGSVISLATRIMSLNPEILAAKTTVYKVLRSAKAANAWPTINEWIVKLDPAALSKEPLQIGDSGKRGWSDQAQWYNYRIKGLIEDGKMDDAIALVDKVIIDFPQQRRFFLRLKALAYYTAKNLPEAEKIYREICGGFKTDWWLLHAYAKVVRDKGQAEQALVLMYRAANSHSKYEAMVKLFADIGFLCKKLGKNDEARAHLCLSKMIREENKWSVDSSLVAAIEELNGLMHNIPAPSTVRDAIKLCRRAWDSVIKKDSNISSAKPVKSRKALLGRICLGKDDRPYCFITADGSSESFFCFKKDLPKGAK